MIKLIAAGTGSPPASYRRKRTSSKAEPAVDFAEEAADRVQPVGGPVWLWPSRVRRPDSMMTRNTPASADPLQCRDLRRDVGRVADRGGQAVGQLQR